MHYQFETIHPFLDGNGRLGRLLIVFFLVVRDRLPEPLLYLSPYFEARRDEYYDALRNVRERGDLGRWLALILDGVRVQATDAVLRAERLTDLREDYRARVRSVTRGAANDLVDLAFEQPVLNARFVESRLSVTRPAALTALRQLADAGILTEITGGPAGSFAGEPNRSSRLSRGTRQVADPGGHVARGGNASQTARGWRRVRCRCAGGGRCVRYLRFR